MHGLEIDNTQNNQMYTITFLHDKYYKENIACALHLSVKGNNSQFQMENRLLF